MKPKPQGQSPSLLRQSPSHEGKPDPRGATAAPLPLRHCRCATAGLCHCSCQCRCCCCLCPCATMPMAAALLHQCAAADVATAACPPSCKGEAQAVRSCPCTAVAVPLPAVPLQLPLPLLLLLLPLPLCHYAAGRCAAAPICHHRCRMVHTNVGHQVMLITLSKGYFCTKFYT